MLQNGAVVLSVLSLCLFVTLVCFGQMVGWIKMPLGMKVGLSPILGPGHIVLDEDPAPPTERGIATSHFLARGQMAGWIRILLGMEVGLSPGDIVLDGDPAPPTERGTAAPSRLVDTWVAHLSNAYLLLVFIVVHLFGVVTD